MKIDSQKYLILKKFLVDVWPLIHPGPTSQEECPIFNLERLERELPSRAGEGLCIAVDDILSESIRWPKETIKVYDRILGLKGCLTVSGARVQYWKKFSRLLKAKRIRTETDYYLLKSLYDDCIDLFDDDEKSMAVQLLEDFEGRQVR